jgi:hypothetical protein
VVNNVVERCEPYPCPPGTRAQMSHYATLIVDGMNAEEVGRVWTRGLKKVEEYDPQRGWLYYMTKRVPEGAEWDFQLPRSVHDADGCHRRSTSQPI